MNREVKVRVDVMRNGVAAHNWYPTRESGTNVRMTADAAIKMCFTGEFPYSKNIDYLTDLIKPYLIINGKEYPVGEYVIGTVVERKKNGNITKVEIEAYDKALILEQNALEQRLFLPAGARYLDIIQAILIDNGIRVILADASAAELQTDREDWDIGTSYLTVINTLLSEINYDTLWFDLDGAARLHRHAQPNANQIQHTYSDGEFSIITDETESTLDIYDAPNVFVAVLSNPEFPEPLYATAENDNPSSILSTVRRGRRIVAPVYRVDNIASQKELQDFIDNRCFESMISTETIRFVTATNPVHTVMDIVALNTKQDTGLFQETEWSLDLIAGGLMEHKARRLVYL